MKSQLKLFFALACLLSLFSSSFAWENTSTGSLIPSIVSPPSRFDFMSQAFPAGDFNGDGIEDVVILTNNWTAAHVIFGNPNSLAGIDTANLTPAQGITIASEVSLIFHVAISAGDLNDDGIDDIMLLSPTYQGAIYIIYGQRIGLQSFSLADMTEDQGRKIISGSGSLVGSNVKVGDFNGDTKQDIFISTNGGLTFVLYGGITWPFTFILGTDSLAGGKGFKMIGKNSAFAKAAAVGDVNGDGKDDFIASGGNAVYVIWGDADRTQDLQISSMTSSQGIKIQGTSSTNLALSTLTVLGDVNGDDIADFAFDNSKQNSVCVIYGGEDGWTDFSISTVPGPRGYVITKSQTQDETAFGALIFRAGDLNGDGLDDMIITNYFETVNGDPNTGAVYVLYSSTNERTTFNVDTISVEEGFKVTGHIAEAYFGGSVAAVDINGDNVNELVFGFPQIEGQSGVVYILYNHTATVTCDFPLILNSDETACIKPCANGLYLKDGQCSGCCDAPWIASTESDVLMCKKPCSADKEFWNSESQTCQCKCEWPWIKGTQDGLAVCERPCEDDSFWNKEEGSCQDECPAPWEISIVEEVEICASPCETGEVWDDDRQECVDPDISLWGPTLANNFGVMILSFITVMIIN